MSSLREWAVGLPAHGRYTFTTAEARARQADISAAGTAAALGRAQADGIIASPIRGFHVVLPLEDRTIGTPAWRLFLDPLMTHLRVPYYVGLLTAAAIHGAGGQAAQVIQVVVARPRRSLRVGRLAIEFIVRRTAGQAPVEMLTTTSGRVRVATPEVVALDLVRYPSRAGGWDNVLAVLSDVAPTMRRSGMRKALAVEPATPEIQRLGHLLGRVQANEVVKPLVDELRTRLWTWVPLDPQAAESPLDCERDSRWRVVVNIRLEPD